MSVAESRPAVSAPKPRWYRLTPDRFVIGLLVVECLLWLSERFQWFAFNEKKGWTVLIAVAVLGVAMILMLLWFVAGLILRCRFQFSVRSLLVLVVAVAIPFSWLAAKMQIAKRQKAAVEEIVKLGNVWVSYDYEFDEFGREIQAAKRPEPAWLRNLLGVDFLSAVAMVRLDNYVPRDGGWTAEPGELENPEEWWASKTKAVDDGLQQFRALTRLRWLILTRSYVSDNGLKNLEGLSQLQSLNLTGTQVTDAGLRNLKGLKQLQRLDLTFTQVTDAGLDNLAALNQLQELELGGTKVTEQGMKKVQQALPKCSIARPYYDPLTKPRK